MKSKYSQNDVQDLVPSIPAEWEALDARNPTERRYPPIAFALRRSFYIHAFGNSTNVQISTTYLPKVLALELELEGLLPKDRCLRKSAASAQPSTFS